MTGALYPVMSDNPLPPGDKPPANVFTRIAEAGNVDDYEDTDHLIAYHKSVNRVKDSGVTEVEDYKLYKVLTDGGCKALSALSWRYDPQSSFVRIDEVNIVRGDSLINVDLTGLSDLPAPQGAIYWGDRIKLLGLPRLQVNDGIEVKSFKKGFTYALLQPDEEVPPDDKYIPPMPGEYFDIVLFQETAPIVEKRYCLQLPRTKPLHSQVYNGTLYSRTTYTEDHSIYEWWALDVPAWGPERYHPGSSDIVPKVVMSTAESWEAKSCWFFQVNENQFAYTEEIKAKVDEILKEAGVSRGNEDEKAKALLHWVANNIRYSGQTMGKGEGFTLHSGEMVFRQRSGVCKDIASMLVVMMRAAGMDSYAAMTMAGSRIEDLPADQFNHSVVGLRKADGSFVMYDPTWAPGSMNIWSKLETEQYYVLGTPEGEDLARIRYSPPEESPLFATGKASIDEKGNLEAEIEFQSKGAVDSRLRWILSYRNPERIKDFITGLLHPVSDRIEGLEFDHGDVSDFNKGMWWKLKFRIPEYAMPVKGGFEFRSPMMLMNMNSRLLFRPGGYRWDEERHDDVFLYYTQLLSGEETFTFPKGYSLVEPPEIDEVDAVYAAFKGDCSMKGRQMTINQTVEIRRRQIPPDGYDGFRDAVNSATDWAETVFRVEKGGAK